MNKQTNKQTVFKEHKMNKQFAITALLFSAMVYSQVGINTSTPHPSSDLELASPDKALLLNRVANTGAIADPVPGMMIYDLEATCAKIYKGDPAAWSDCLDGSGNGNPGSSGTITGLTCGSAHFQPAMATRGTAYSGYLEIPYTGGNGGAYAGQSFTENGLTFTLTAGNFATGAGNLVYNITGTPTMAGTTSLNITAGGQSCSGSGTIYFIVNAPTPASPAGTGTLTGKSCFDVVETNNGGDCGTLASRASQKANFALTATNTQTYTFNPSGTVSNVRFVYVNTNGSVIQSLTGGNPGNNISTSVNATVVYFSNLNAAAAGLSTS